MTIWKLREVDHEFVALGGSREIYNKTAHLTQPLQLSTSGCNTQMENWLWIAIIHPYIIIVKRQIVFIDYVQ